MKIDNLINHKATGEAGNSFVGMKIINNQIHFYFPEAYHFEEEYFNRDDYLDLLKTISIAKSSSSITAETNDSRREASDLAILSYIWILEDYLTNGFHITFNKIYVPNQRGKVNWKRTLAQQPMISGRNIVFSELIAEVMSPQNSILAEAHRYCIKKSSALIGWMYGISPNSIEIAPNADNMVPQYLSALRDALDRSFNDDVRSRLIHMENVLIGLDEFVDENKSIVYGVDTYHYVFERMIDHIFGNEKVEEYYPKFKWHLKFSEEKEDFSGPTIRPDTIMTAEDNIYIIDSKFYRYGSLDISKTNGLPEASSIVKQITYGSYVETTHKNKNIYNVFVLPYDSKSEQAERMKGENKELVYVGYVNSEWKKDKQYSKVHTFLIDLRHVVRTWNRMVHDRDRRQIVEQIDEKVISIKDN